MQVHFMCAYYSQWAHTNLAPRSQPQWYAFKFCRAVKKRHINGTLEFPWKAGAETINAESVGRARWIFGYFIKSVLTELGLPEAPILVPVPSKDGLVGATTFRSLEMLRESVAPHGQFTIAPVLRFTHQLQPANSGGPRGREVLKPYMRVVEQPPDGPIILVDDLLTTGGSILASYDKLEEIGRAPVAAIVCGHTVSDSLLNAFGHHRKDVQTTPTLFEPLVPTPPVPTGPVGG
jgi:hypothetical protein